MDKILIFKNQVTQYDVMHYFRKSLSDALEKKGIRIELIDIANMTKPELLQIIYRDSPDYTLAFNGLLPMGGQFISDLIQIPHVAWLVDSAHYFDEMRKGPLNLIISPDQYSADLHQSWGASHSFFLPHGFDASITTPPGGERPFPIVFLGTFIDPIDILEAWNKSMPQNQVQELIQAANEVHKDPMLSYQKAITNINNEFWSRLSFQELSALNISFDLYIRATERIELLKSLCGLPVHIFGNKSPKRGWEDFLDFKKGNYTIHPPVDFPKSLEIMKQSQIVLNSSPMFKTGAHERIFYGLGLGAAVLTNKTAWIQENYHEDEEILLYNFQENLKQRVEELLFSPGKLTSIAQKGQEKVLKNDTWDVRADSLLEIMEREYETFQ